MRKRRGMLPFIFAAYNHHKLQLGGPDGELAASMRYLNQRYTVPYGEIKGILTDVGTEELAHLEMVGAILYQLTKGLSAEQIRAGGMDQYFVDHTAGIYPVSAAGVPADMKYIAVKGDLIADLNEDLAADATTTKEQPAFPRGRKPLISLAFRHFEGFRKNGIPATTQEQLDPNLH